MFPHNLIEASMTIHLVGYYDIWWMDEQVFLGQYSSSVWLTVLYEDMYYGITTIGICVEW